MSLVEEGEIFVTLKESDPTAKLDELEVFEHSTDKVVELMITQNLKEVRDDYSDSDEENKTGKIDVIEEQQEIEDDICSSDSGDEDTNESIEIPISKLVAKLKRKVVEDNIASTVQKPTECAMNFDDFFKDEQTENNTKEEEEFEFSDANIETGKPTVVSEAKIIQRADSIQQTVIDNSEYEPVEDKTFDQIKQSMQVTKTLNANEIPSDVSISPAVDIQINEANEQITYNKTIEETPKTNDTSAGKTLMPPKRKARHVPSGRTESRSKLNEEVLSNYDIIDRTEVKKLQPESDFLSFANVFGRLKRAFTGVDQQYKRNEVNDERHSFVHSTVVNLSIEETKNGEQMQVITLSHLAKTSSKNDDSGKITVYVDELEKDYFRNAEEQDNDYESDHSCVSEEDIDVVDNVFPNKSDSYDLQKERDDNGEKAVVGVAIKSNIQRSKLSKTFGGSASDIPRAVSKYRRGTVGTHGMKLHGIGGMNLMPFQQNDLGTLKKKTLPNEPFVLLTDGYPANVPAFPSDRRSLIALEIYTTERTFVRGLEIIVHLFRKRIMMNNLLDAKEIKLVFSNIDKILTMNRDILDDLFERICDWSDEQCVGDIFVNHEEDFKIYADYCKTYDSGEAVMKQKMKKKKDLEILLASCYSNPICVPGLTLSSYLITVIQRIPRYILLFRDLLKKTSDSHPDYENLIRSQTMMERVAQFINEQLKQEQCAKALAALQTQIVGLKAYYTPDRTLVHEGDVCLLTSKKTYHCVLFNDLLVFAVKGGARQTAVELTLDIKTVWVEDLDELDPQTTKRDAIAIYTPERPYTMYVGSMGEKKIWMKNLEQAIRENLYGKNKEEEQYLETRKTHFLYKDETVYSGFYHNAKRHGQGTGMWPNQYTYIGEWEDDERNGYGVLNFSCGDNYEGEWVDNKQEGKGTYMNKNGDKIIGHWREGRKHGDVIIEYANGDRFKGTCQKDKITGEGEFICISGFYYKGTWMDNLRHGEGKLVTPDGFEYMGEFSYNKFHGSGELHYPDNSVYKGEFYRGERSSSGTYTREGCWSYEGEWMHDLKDGRGKMTYGNGDVYEGTWVQDMRVGQGVMIYSNGGYYRGQWIADLMHGSGILETRDGSIYDGEFVCSKMTGSGKMRYKNGTMYQGFWKDNCPEGKGILTKPGQWSCDGSWSQGKQNGYCTLLDPANNYSYEGEWFNGVKKGSGKEVVQDTTFEGNFADDLRKGPGIEKYTDGTIYEGDWSRGQKHGSFIQRKQHGVVEHQIWSQGCLVRTPTELPPNAIPALQRWL